MSRIYEVTTSVTTEQMWRIEVPDSFDVSVDFAEWRRAATSMSRGDASEEWSAHRVTGWSLLEIAATCADCCEPADVKVPTPFGPHYLCDEHARGVALTKRRLR
jgi:hypothetical protein